MTGEEWDVHWYRAYRNAVDDGLTPDEARVAADRETAEQFGPRPQDGGGELS